MKKQKQVKKQTEVVGDLEAQNSALQKIIKTFKKSFNQSSTERKGKKFIFSILAFTILLVISSLNGNAMDNSHTVFSCAGNCFKISGCSLEWTLGETVIASFEVGNSCVSQGFHQLGFITTSASEELLGKLGVYPNPFTSNLTISFNDPSKWGNAVIYDLTGNIVKQLPLITHNSLQLEFLTPGMYFIKITDEEKNCGTIKIIKK